MGTPTEGRAQCALDDIVARHRPVRAPWGTLHDGAPERAAYRARLQPRLGAAVNAANLAGERASNDFMAAWPPTNDYAAAEQRCAAYWDAVRTAEYCAAEGVFLGGVAETLSGPAVTQVQGA